MADSMFCRQCGSQRPGHAAQATSPPSVDSEEALKDALANVIAEQNWDLMREVLPLLQNLEMA